VAEAVYSFDSFFLFCLIEAEGWSHVDVVGDCLCFCLGPCPFFDVKVAWFHGHGEAAELDGFGF
jgi:hypothetical protein